MSNYYKNIENHFDTSDEKLLRSTEYNSLEKYLFHYESRMFKILTNNNISNILDLGCGDGKVLKKFATKYPEKKFIGVDISKKNIELAKKQNFAPNVEYIVHNVCNSFEFTQKIDLVFSFSVIQYFNIENSKKLLENLINIISDEGCILHMSIPDLNHKNKLLLEDKFNLVKFIFNLMKSIFRKKLQYNNNSYFWSKDELISQYHKYFFDVNSYTSDSWYRFDLIARKKLKF